MVMNMSLEVDRPGFKFHFATYLLYDRGRLLKLSNRIFSSVKWGQ